MDDFEREGLADGVCRRFPRSSVYGPGAADNDRIIQSTFPTVNGNFDWCGEWQAANPQTVDEAATVMARNVLAGDAQAGRALADKLMELVVLPDSASGPA